jgi:hypothetical protein
MENEKEEYYFGGNTEIEQLVGRKTVSVEINEEKDLMLLKFEDGSQLYISATGGCCSKSWFEHVSGVEALLGEVVLAVDVRQMPADTEVDYETIRYYGWSVKTARGSFDIEMRNQSNGYYGGDIKVASRPLDTYSSRRHDVGNLRKLEDF